MSRRRQRADEFRHLAGDVGPEDGGDPKADHAKPWDAPKQASRKAQQLCRQVMDALTSAFAACGDPAVQATAVQAVAPAPHTGRLRVLVGRRPTWAATRWRRRSTARPGTCGPRWRRRSAAATRRSWYSR